ncbi:MAG TPA: RNA-processing protein, partial [Thermoplasmata archaeon]|nr:RNA-processing protein [Thermoplasmata archaeon]
MALLSDDIYLELIDIRHYTGKNQRRVREMRGRLIGRDGRTRQLIEEHSDVDLSIYGNTVAIIGTIESLEAAKHAVDMLLRGARHGTVYRYLERRKREMRKSEFRQLTTG